MCYFSLECSEMKLLSISISGYGILLSRPLCFMRALGQALLLAGNRSRLFLGVLFACVGSRMCGFVFLS